MINKVLIVLGFTLNSDGSAAPTLVSRLEKCHSLFQKGDKIIVCGKGTPKAFTKGHKAHKSEAEVMRDYLINKGVAKESLLVEKKSTSTFTNAYYSYVDHISKLNAQSLVVISNEFHMPSVKYCFDLVYGPYYQIQYQSCSNEGLDAQELEIWKERLQKMVSVAYPILFKDIDPGDIHSISKVVKEAHASVVGSSRKAFEKVCADIAGIHNPEELRGFI